MNLKNLIRIAFATSFVIGAVAQETTAPKLAAAGPKPTAAAPKPTAAAPRPTTAAPKPIAAAPIPAVAGQEGVQDPYRGLGASAERAKMALDNRKASFDDEMKRADPCSPRPAAIVREVRALKDTYYQIQGEFVSAWAERSENEIRVIEDEVVNLGDKLNELNKLDVSQQGDLDAAQKKLAEIQEKVQSPELAKLAAKIIADIKEDKEVLDDTIEQIKKTQQAYEERKGEVMLRRMEIREAASRVTVGKENEESVLNAKLQLTLAKCEPGPPPHTDLKKKR